MAQHDNGRRAARRQGEAWQPGHQGLPDQGDWQQDQSAGGRQGGQHGGHRESAYGSHLDQYDPGRPQHGDNWRDEGGRGAWRAGRDDRDADWGSPGGQGSFGGQASDNDYGNRGITESGNFGNYGGRDPGRQRFDASYGQGYADNGRPDDTYGRGRGGGDWNPGYRGPRNDDRYGDRGYQGNWQAGQGGQAFHDPDYHQWRNERLRELDRDYDDWRQHRYQRFSDEFNEWRNNRDARRDTVNRDADPGVTDAGRPSTASTKGTAK